MKTFVRLLIALCMLVATFASGQPQNDAATPKPPDAQGILDFLNQSITWYQQSVLQEQIATEPAGILLANENRKLADQILRFSFEFARNQAAQLGDARIAQAGTPENGSRRQNLAATVAKSEAQIKERQAQLLQLRAKLETAKGPARRQTELLISEVESEIDLLQTRATLLRNMLDFASGAQGSSTNLRAQIEELARTVPVADKPAQASGGGADDSAANSAANVAASRGPEPSGILSLISSLTRNTRKLRNITRAINLTDELAQKSKDLRAPYRSEIKELVKRGDELANGQDLTDPVALQQQKAQLDSLTTQLKSKADIILPLSKQRVLLDVYKRNLTNWQTSAREQYTSDLRALVIRIAILGVLIIMVLGAAELWRRAIFRYVQDARRRYQLLLFRRIVMWFVIAIIVALAFATELGALATFAGLLTAGVAVALQNVISSVAAYFFLIGKYGIRVGDRVQIAGVTGEVIDIGLVRLHLMELGSGPGDGEPSGRIVVFSNSVIFQPNAGVFKQIPGTSFVWHEVTLTLAPDRNYHAIEQRLVDAVNSVFSGYRERMEKQRRLMEKALNSVAGATVSETALNPRTRLKLKQTGLEFVITYPVEVENSVEMDDRIARALLDAIDREPKLKVVGSGTPNIQPLAAAEHA